MPGWVGGLIDFEKDIPINRIAYTEQDVQYKLKIMQKMQELGMQLTYDSIGNICGTLPAKGKAQGNLALLYHTDSVPDGGQYDGAAGMVSYLMAIENLQKQGVQLHNNIHVVNCASEESSTFGHACIGSKYLGHKLGWGILGVKNRQGVSLADSLTAHEKMLQQGMRDNKIQADKVEAVVGKSQCDTSIELHIEQYKSLQESGNKIGIVTSIPSAYRMRVQIEGESAHSGATPMHDRKDAMRAHTEFSSRLYRLADSSNGNILVTIPGIETGPMSMTTIQNDVRFPIDIRLHHPVASQDIAKHIQEIIMQVEQMTGVKFKTELLNKAEPTKTDEGVSKKLHTISEGLGLATTEMKTGAGHDTAFFPAAKKGFVHLPSEDRDPAISKGPYGHTPKEYTSPQNIRNGAAIVQKAIIQHSKEGKEF